MITEQIRPGFIQQAVAMVASRSQVLEPGRQVIIEYPGEPAVRH
jgi:hypothetical protein